MTNTVSTLDYLNQQLVDAIELARRGGTNAFEFVQEQAPQVVREVIAWEITVNAVLAVALLAAAIVVAWGSRKIYRKFIEDSAEELTPIPIVFGGFIVALLLAFSVASAIDAAKPIIAPRLFLMEYVANLVKGK